MSEAGIDGVMALAQRRIIGRMKFFFAFLTLLAGMVLALGTDSNGTALVAISFTIIGYVFVDTLRWFALPTMAAYAAMLVVCCYCISDFFPLDDPSNNQLVAVATLLALIQSIMMLQHKNRRIFEQLTTFCLLELVVAATFNHALSYGILLLPLGIACVAALALLAATHATESAIVFEDEASGTLGNVDELLLDARKASALILGLRRESPDRSGDRVPPNVTWSAPQSIGEVAHRAPPMLRTTAAMLVPSVLLLSMTFFYALPRTTDATIEPTGPAAVGFSDQLNLDQIGRMNANASVALRVSLRHQRDGRAYRVDEPIYLRGRVLEKYSTRSVAGRLTAIWNSASLDRIDSVDRLPVAASASESRQSRSKKNKVDGDDRVVMTVLAESSRSSAMFSVPPYYRNPEGDDVNVDHSIIRQTIQHGRSQQLWYPRARYTMISDGLSGGRPTPWLSFTAGLPNDQIKSASQDQIGRRDFGVDSKPVPNGPADNDLATGDGGVDRTTTPTMERTVLDSRWAEDYLESLSQVDRVAMPSAVALAERFAEKNNGEARNAREFCEAVANYLASSPEYSYTLDLNFATSDQIDPIEKFASIDKAGHCQFFASLLVMTLRSHGIAARMVAGYCTDEYNQLSDRYIARGSHAHAWAEALVPAECLRVGEIPPGQPAASHYWMRLDPTPSSRLQANASAGVSQQAIDMASNLWDDYVVEMDRGRQTDVLSSQDNSLHLSYLDLIKRLVSTVEDVRTGEFEGADFGSLGFSPIAAGMGLVVVLVGLSLFRFRPRLFRLGRGDSDLNEVSRPRLDFFVQTMNQLDRMGMRRSHSQTPQEFVRAASAAIDEASKSKTLTPDAGDRLAIDDPHDIHDDLVTLADWYYRLRFGRDSEGPSQSNQIIDVALARLRHRIDQL